jgi:hypothetical protein
MSEQAAEQGSGEQGSLNLGISHAAGAASEPAAASSPDGPEKAIEKALLAAAEMKMASASVSEPSASEPPKAEASAQASRPETAKDDVAHLPGKVIVMSRGERAWTDSDIHSEPQTDEQQSVFGKRRIAAIAAVLALATAAGAVGGALATASLMHGSSDVAMSTSQSPLETSLSRIDSDIQSLKAGLDHTSKIGMSQFNKTSDRLDKLERAQADPAGKLAKLSEAIDKLHALPVPPPAVAAAPPAASSASKETTGSITPASSQQASALPVTPKIDAKADVKTEVGRLPTLDDWILRDVGYGGALIGGRHGSYEVYAGDMIPGLGRVDAIRRQDGHWVVVTSRGLIVAR